MLTEKTISQVRERANILDQFDNTKIKRIGSEFVAQCQWHEDKRPSLSISPAKNFAFCHVCARGVDSIGWIQDRQGLTFAEAVISLAGRYGVPVEMQDAEDNERYEREREERKAAHQKADEQQAKFSEQIWDSPGLDYLLGRGLTYETIEEWGLGFNGNRVMFPLRDPRGQVVAFTGRVLDDSKPKYKNSQNSLIYQKAEMVYGLDKAAPEITKTGHVVITEGQFDVIRCWQEGVRNMICVSGSSLTKAMIAKLVKSYKVKRITLCFDGDLGGEKAAERAVAELQDSALRGELDLRILTLPEGSDPADLAEMMEFLIDEAPHWVEHSFERAVAKIDLSDPQAISTAEYGVKRLLRVLPKGGLREYVQRRAKEVLQAVPDVAPAKIQTQRQIDRCHWAERRALRLYLLDEGCRPALGGIVYTDPRMQQAWSLIQLFEGMGQKQSLRIAFAACLPKLDKELADELMSLCNPIAEIARVIEANPVNELEGAMAVLLTDCCSSSNTHG